MRQATVIGSGPNGLAAAVALARAGLRVRVWEAADQPGGAARTAALTLPGYAHDVGSAVHPAAIASPFFRAFGLDRRVEWLVPEASYAHPLDDAPAVVAWRDLDRTAQALGPDARAWRALVRPLVRHIDDVVEFTGDQLLRMPRHPLVAARFGARVLEQGTQLLSRTGVRTAAAKALITGAMAHANTALPSPAAAAAGLLLAAHAHAGGWGLPRGGAGAITDALLADLATHGGTVETGRRIDSLTGLDWGDPDAGDLLILDTSPRLLLTLEDLPSGYRRALTRYRYGPAAAKVDFALRGEIPWTDPAVRAAPTVHLGGTREEIIAAERAVSEGRVPAAPYVLLVQPSVIDPTRAPDGHSAVWAYVHVPLGSHTDPTETITAQIERFAPGFASRVLASAVVTAAARSVSDPDDIGGDILGGSFTLVQAVRRPVLSRHPWRTPARGVYLASASTPPGPAVHGMNGWHAARTALTDATGVKVDLDDLFGG